MIFDLIRNGLTIDLVVNMLARIFIIFCVLPFHEFAHAFVAQKFGDDTARLKGRLTLNPLAHVDPFGALMIIVAGFGYAKPVPVNPRRFKNPRKGMALTALAGPVSNLLMAVILMFISQFGYFGFVKAGGTLFYVIYMFFYYAAFSVILSVSTAYPHSYLARCVAAENTSVLYENHLYSVSCGGKCRRYPRHTSADNT